MNQITVDALATLHHPTLIDVRESSEYTEGHVPGAVNVPLSELPGRVEEVPTGMPVHVICQAGARSAQATELLTGHGINAINVEGGTNAWIQHGHPLEDDRA